MEIAVIGAGGFVGSAFIRQLRTRGYLAEEVRRETFGQHHRKKWDLVIDAASNSRKYLAEKEPWKDFELTAIHKAAVLECYPAHFHLHISSVDVYADLSGPATTKEDSAAGQGASCYGFNKWLAEEMVKFYAEHHLIFRLAGMVGPGLKKNPVYDILHETPIRIHPESQYQFLSTDDAARLCLELWERGCDREIFNICGKGLISPTEIARLAACPLQLGEHDCSPRIVYVDQQKLKAVCEIPSTLEVIRNFLKV
jgi:nucleoside-diphosphate-sugar epimerase